MVIGHEGAGIIEVVGSEVKHLVPGDRVVLEPRISCWQCEPCKQGFYNLCYEVLCDTPSAWFPGQSDSSSCMFMFQITR